MVISLFSVTPERALQISFSSPRAAVGTIVTAWTGEKMGPLPNI